MLIEIKKHLKAQNLFFFSFIKIALYSRNTTKLSQLTILRLKIIIKTNQLTLISTTASSHGP